MLGNTESSNTSTDLRASSFCLVLLFHRGDQGATYSELESWVRPSMRANLRRTLHRLENDKDFVHPNGEHYFITRLGEREVDSKDLLSSD